MKGREVFTWKIAGVKNKDSALFPLFQMVILAISSGESNKNH